jgi:hypothetical protein
MFRHPTERPAFPAGFFAPWALYLVTALDLRELFVLT